jgi:hypothetical protein
VKAIQDYLRHAQECEQLAKTAISDEQRQMILKMAETWRLLARQRERHLRAKARIEAMGGAGRTTEKVAARNGAA